MHTYLQHLLQDIAAATAHPDELPHDGLERDDFEGHIMEVERYLHQEPDTTLSEHTGLEKVQFPDEGRLTEQQCATVFEALVQAYSSHGVALVIPEGIPMRACYRTAVEALDQKVFISRHGDVNLEYCHYDFDGYCPFGVDRCPCFVDMEKEVGQSKATAGSYEHYNAAWYRLLTELAEARAQLEATHMPNRAAVQALYQHLDTTWLTMHRDDYTIYYRPKPEEIPGTPGCTLAEWAGCPALVFPPYGQMHPLEAELLTLAMLRLLGKEHVTLSAMALEQPARYEALVGHLGCELRRDETATYWLLVCPPGQPTMYALVKEKGLDQWGEDMDMTGTPTEEGDLPF